MEGIGKFIRIYELNHLLFVLTCMSTYMHASYLKFCPSKQLLRISLQVWVNDHIHWCFQQRQEDIANISIQTRSKAHNIIRRMLASLGDPYTRFLPPAEVTLPFTFIFSVAKFSSSYNVWWFKNMVRFE